MFLEAKHNSGKLCCSETALSIPLSYLYAEGYILSLFCLSIGYIRLVFRSIGGCLCQSFCVKVIKMLHYQGPLIDLVSQY